MAGISGATFEATFNKQQILLITEELCLLRIKYEQLIQISKTLLASWPQDQEKTPKELPPPPSPPPPPSLPPPTEIEHIDKILAKAQRLRVQKTTPSSYSYSKSLQKAKSVYGGTKSTSSSIKKKTSIDVDVTMDTTSKHIKPHPPPAAPSPTKPFTLQQDGKSLKLPNKYGRIKNITTKFDEQFKVIDDGHCDFKKNVFIESISEQKTDEEREQNIELFLQKKELLLLQETFLALTPHELTATELEDVVKSKVKLESLFQCVDRPLRRVPPLPSPSPPPLLEGHALGYRLEYMKLSLEKEFLQLCTSSLIPLLQSLHPSDQKYTLLVHLIQNIAGLKKTVFVSLEDTSIKTTTTK